MATVFLLSGSFSFAAVQSIDNGYAEKITGFAVNMTLNDNGTLHVSEHISYDFGNNQKHGIYRYIPIIYKGRVGNPRQNISLPKVSDDAGRMVPSNVEWNDYYANIVIGDPDKLVSGVKNYKIDYTVNRVISSDANGDRFDWDAIGAGWEIPINNAIITLTTSKKAESALTTLDCYVGGEGSGERCDITQDEVGSMVAIKNLKAHEGITFDAMFKAGTFPKPSTLEVFFWEQPWYYILPIITLLAYLVIWFKKARGARGRGTIVPIYDAPKDLRPTEASIVLDDYVSSKSLSAEIIFMATRGYLKIRRVESKMLGLIPHAEYQLLKLKTPDSGLTATESKLLDALFAKSTPFEDESAEEKKLILSTLPKSTKPIGVMSLSDISEDFTTQNFTARRLAYKDVTKKGFYVINPIMTKVILAMIAGGLLAFGGILAFYMLAGFVQIVCMVTPGLIGLAFVFLMPEKTHKGMIAKEDLLGLKMYIKTAEIDRIKFHNAPAKSPQKFEELLPYAIIFGLEKEWADEFKDVYKTPPTWYDGNFAAFSVVALTNDISSFSTAAMGAAASSAASSSGGFSGGGGGGGGGGSW